VFQATGKWHERIINILSKHAYGTSLAKFYFILSKLIFFWQ